MKTLSLSVFIVTSSLYFTSSQAFAVSSTLSNLFGNLFMSTKDKKKQKDELIAWCRKTCDPYKICTDHKLAETCKKTCTNVRDDIGHIIRDDEGHPFDGQCRRRTFTLSPSITTPTK